MAELLEGFNTPCVTVKQMNTICILQPKTVFQYTMCNGQTQEWTFTQWRNIEVSIHHV